MRLSIRQSIARNTRCFGSKTNKAGLTPATIASTLLSVLVLALVLLGFSCAPATTLDPKQNAEPTASGPPIKLNLDSVQTNNIVLAWTPPVYKGTKTGEILLQENELAYQVYFIKKGMTDDPPTGEEVKSIAISTSPAQKAGTARGVTNIQIKNLESGSRYFLVVETYNSFAAASTLSEEMIEIVMPIRFAGDLSYTETEHELMVYDSATTIVPDIKPTTATSEAPIIYVLEKTEGDLSDTVISIDEGTGEITVDPTTTGTARFVVRAEATGYFSQELSLTVRIVPRVAGAVTGLSIDSTSREDHSFEVQWVAPVETGTRQDGTRLELEDLVYRVYYISGNVGDTKPDAENLAQDARGQSLIEEVQGSTNIRLFDLSSGTRYFVAVETYNPFTEVSTLSEDVIEATSTTGTADLSGMLAYGQSEYSYPVSSSTVTITPSDIPTVTGGASISYGLYKKGGVRFPMSTVRIDAMTGTITVDPSTAMVAGAVNYRIFAQVARFNTQYVEITIRITQIEMAVTPYYSQDAGAVIPVPIGQAIRDESLADDEMVLSIESSGYSSDPGSEYTVHLDTGLGIGSSRGARFTKSPNAGNRIVIQKSELVGTNNLSRSNGAVIGLSGPGIAGIQEVAIYRPGEIRNWQDLQAMRVDLYGNYVLKNDIRFPDAEEGTSNFEPIGEIIFKGTLEGTNGTESFRIIGMRIESTEDNAGLFGKLSGSVKNLVFVDSTVRGRNYVGTLTGYFGKGIVKNVGVELSALGKGVVAGFITDAPGHITGRNVGGLVGYNSGGSIEGYSEAPAMGSENVGGLVGLNYKDDAVVIGYSTGDVTGAVAVGGLVGQNSTKRDGISIMGYSTGDVTGIDAVGGIVGQAHFIGKLKGYSTGKITGVNHVGGLVGYVQLGVNITGYTVGDVTGESFVGGMLGSITSAGTVAGYSRSTIYRSKGNFTDFGRTVGAPFAAEEFYNTYYGEYRIYTEEEVLENIRRRTYSSQGSPPESQLLNADGREMVEYLGEDGNRVNIGAINDITLFSELFNPAEVRDWIWIENGKWPALDLGGLISAADQPIY